MFAIAHRWQSKVCEAQLFPGPVVELSILESWMISSVTAVPLRNLGPGVMFVEQRN